MYVCPIGYMYIIYILNGTYMYGNMIINVVKSAISEIAQNIAYQFTFGLLISIYIVQIRQSYICLLSKQCVTFRFNLKYN